MRENIIVAIVDDAILDMWVKMPYLQSKPDGRWGFFNEFIVNYPVCGVSRANIFTGRRRANLEGLYWHGPCDDLSTGTMAKWNQDLSPNHHYPKWLKDAGYYNGMLHKWLNVYPYTQGDGYIPAGYDFWRGVLEDSDLGGAHAAHVGPRHFNYYINKDTVISFVGTGDTWTTTGADASGRTATTAYSTDRISMWTKDFLDAAVEPQVKEPFYLHIGFHAVKPDITAGNAEASRHSAPGFSMPWTTADRPTGFNEADISDKPAWLRSHFPNPAGSAQIADWDTVQQQKWRMCQAIDEWLRDTVTALKARTTSGRSGTWHDRTVIILMTENSNLHGEHRLEHKGLPYEASIRSPFHIRHPSIPVGNLTSSAMISTFDLAPTFCEIAKIRPTRPVDGMSILPLLDGRMTESQWRQTMISEWRQNNSVNGMAPSWKCARTHTHKLIKWEASTVGGTFAAEDELYELSTDPAELTNRIDDAALASVRTDLNSRLATIDAASKTQ